MSQERSSEPVITTQHREQLTYLLSEAAEIEHGLMCCYLFAAYSLKRGEVDGLSAADAAMVGRWRAAILDVAIDEMLHLALVSNLLTAIGSAPHFERANFPVSPGYHPAGVVIGLAPFNLGTIDHFVFLERPEGVDVPDGAGFEAPAPYERSVEVDRLVPSAQDYATVGHLYRGILAGFERLAAVYGEGRLFVGDPAAQVGPELAPLRGLIAVTDLASAQRAVRTIVEQGEGSPDNPETSHYRRFVQVRDELRATLAARPDFEPAHPVARNPVMRKPPVPQGKVHLDDPAAAHVVDFGNAVYAFALRCLGRAFGEADDPTEARRLLIEASLTAMRDLAPIMQLLARLPASHAQPGTTAGLTFTMQRFTVGFTQQRAAWALLAERAGEIETVARRLARDIDGSLEPVGQDFGALADSIARANPARRAPASPAALRPPPRPPPRPALRPPPRPALRPPPAPSKRRAMAASCCASRASAAFTRGTACSAPQTSFWPTSRALGCTPRRSRPSAWPSWRISAPPGRSRTSGSTAGRPSRCRR
ncbi:MAG: ferritin-like protein [Polyangiaceae bacterium]|nr:ferritin-like protein [Polyangiaceae bacterium]